jgi:hypothetical protein
MNKNAMPLLGAAIVFATFLIGGCSGKVDTADKIELQAATEPELSNKSSPKALSSPVRDAMLSMGAKCDERKRARSGCKWQGISYTINEPDDWNAQIAKFRSACESGVFSEDYNVVSNEQSWIVSAADGAEPTIRLYAELAKQDSLGPQPKLVKLCDL